MNSFPVAGATSDVKTIMLKLLCVTAHPDDEAGAFGGTLLLYHERGVETSVICLTAGTAARNRGPHAPLTNSPLCAAPNLPPSCKLLHVSHGEVLDYADSQLDRANFYQATGDTGVPDTSTPSAHRAHLRYGRRTHRPYRSRNGGHTYQHGIRRSAASRSLSRADQARSNASRAEALLRHCGLRAARSPANRSPTVTASRSARSASTKSSQPFDCTPRSRPCGIAVEKTLASGLPHARCITWLQLAIRAKQKLETDLFEGVVED